MVRKFSRPQIFLVAQDSGFARADAQEFTAIWTYTKKDGIIYPHKFEHVQQSFRWQGEGYPLIQTNGRFEILYNDISLTALNRRVIEWAQIPLSPDSFNALTLWLKETWDVDFRFFYDFDYANAICASVP